MKKFLAFLLILIILGGVAFFFGWAQFPLEAGEYGVMRSKTHGLDKTVIRDGDFRWVWYKLIPRNVTITGFSLNTQRYSFTLSGKLPSADVYAGFTGMEAGAEDAFGYDLSLTVSFTLNPEALPALVEERNITSQQEIDEYQRNLASQCADFARQSILSGGMDGVLAGTDGLEAELAQKFPQTEHLAIAVQADKVPDMALYRTAKGMYEDYLAKQRESLAAGLEQNAKNRALFQTRLDELAKYGELLTKYPVLLQKNFAELLGGDTN